MKKLIWLLVLLLIPLPIYSASQYEIGRIYKDGKVTIVDVTYWEWESITEIKPYSVLLTKKRIKETVAYKSTDGLSTDLKTKLSNKDVADTAEIRVEGTYPYTYEVKTGKIATERITYNADVSEAEIYKELDSRVVKMGEVVK